MFFMYFLQFFNVFSWNERWLTDYVDVLEVMDRLKQKRSFNWSFSLIKLESWILTVEPIIYWFPADIIIIRIIKTFKISLWWDVRGAELIILSLNKLFSIILTAIEDNNMVSPFLLQHSINLSKTFLSLWISHAQKLVKTWNFCWQDFLRIISLNYRFLNALDFH